MASTARPILTRSDVTRGRNSTPFDALAREWDTVESHSAGRCCDARAAVADESWVACGPSRAMHRERGANVEDVGAQPRQCSVGVTLTRRYMLRRYCPPTSYSACE